MTTLLEYGRQGLPLPFPVIDMHGHLGAYAYTIPDLSAGGMVEVMDRLGVEHILISHMRCMSPHSHHGNAQVLEAMQAYPGRILGYVSFWPQSAEHIRVEAESWLAAGFTGLKLHNSNGFSYTDPAYLPAYAIANERRLPVLFHTWGDAGEFAQIREIAGQYPDLNILLGHSGSANETFYIEAAREYPNMFCETCFSRAPRGMVARLVDAVGVDKVVWGSDGYFYNQAQQIGRVLGAQISDEDKCKILRDNALGILSVIRR
ncbi:MAG: amidohydrolase family protein [Armatimonadota bacterium]